jgi:hypothetical protein
MSSLGDKREAFHSRLFCVAAAAMSLWAQAAEESLATLIQEGNRKRRWKEFTPERT